MKGRRRKPRFKDSLEFPNLLPARPNLFGREKAIDRAVRSDRKLSMLARLLRRHDDLEGFCFALGWIAQNWAMIEQNFEMCIAMIYHDMNGKKIVSPQLPLPWNQKVKFLKNSFAKIPALQSYAAEGLDLVDRADSLAAKRNDLIHGTIRSLRPIDRKWALTIFDYDRSDKRTNWHVLREFRFGVDEFSKLEGKLVPLAGEVARFGHRLLKEVAP
jgi:hypothetical protein